MKKILYFLIFSVALIVSRAQTPAMQWAKSFGGPGGDMSNSIALDASGNVYTTGTFSGTVDFDPGVGSYTLNSLSSDVFISKLDASGNFVWAKQFSIVGLGMSYSIFVDGAGNVYTTGYFQGSADFDPGVGTFNITSGGGYDVFVSKLNSSGAFVWAKQLGGPSYDISYAVTVDAAGNVFTTGTFQGGGDYDPGAGTFMLNPSGSADAFISKLNSSGNFVWAKQFESSNTAVGSALTTDAAGNVYISGYFSSFTDFDTGPGVLPFSALGSTDIFVCKLTSSGALGWAKQMGGTLGDWSTSIVLDPAGNVFTTGRFMDVVDFDPDAGTYTMIATGSSADVYVSKLNSSGVFVWAKQLGGTSDDIGNGIALDLGGNVYTAGFFQGTADFDPGVGSFSLTSAGQYEIYISKLDPSGSFVWAKQLGSIDADISQAIVVDGSDNVYTTGYFWGTPDFDPGAGTYTLTSVGDNDVYVHKMCIVPPPPNDATPVGNLNICTGNSTTLSASSTGSITWYASPNGTIALGTGTTFITPTLSIGSYTFYAESSICYANPTRAAIVITVNPLPVFSAGSNKPGGMCAGETATLTVTGVTSATWFPGGPGVSISVSPSVTTSYTVYGANGGCAIAAVIVQPIAPCSGMIEFFKTNSSLTIYPNPVINELNIKNSFNADVELSVYDCNGKLILNKAFAANETVYKINTSQYAQGIYYLRLISLGNYYTSKVEIIKN